MWNGWRELHTHSIFPIVDTDVTQFDNVQLFKGQRVLRVVDAANQVENLQYPSYVKLSKTNNPNVIQCPLDIATLDIAAALAIATATPATDLRHYINSDLGYSDRKFLALFTK